MTKENNLRNTYKISGIVVFFILLVLGIFIGLNEYRKHEWNNRNCYQFSIRDYWLDEVPLRCKWQQIKYKNNTPDLPNFENPRQ